MLEIISNSKEFDEVPVRHNEDNLNEGLAKICPYPVNMKVLESPNTKTLLLFQVFIFYFNIMINIILSYLFINIYIFIIKAHFSRLELPIRDYLTDTKLILDSSIRIICCLVDLSADKGYNLELSILIY